MIRTDLRLPVGYTHDDLIAALTGRLPVTREECRTAGLHLLRRALELSDRAHPCYKLTVALTLDPEREAGLLKMRKKVSAAEDFSLPVPQVSPGFRPVVVGAGPAGLFAALTLARAGTKPLLLERGKPVEEREKTVAAFFRTGILDPECNVQFGEGGAGTFSDGKLKYGSMDRYKYAVLSDLVRAGAPEDILFCEGAHVGTDRLGHAVSFLRREIQALGGEVLFGAKVTGLSVGDGAVRGVRFVREGREETFSSPAVLLAVGHSARDTFARLSSLGVPMQSRPFGIGVRIEHPRPYINDLVYGAGYSPLLPQASYHLVTHLPGGRSAYSFCMCPGGSVVAAASEPGGIVTNGMSNYARDGENSNAALLVSVTPADFPSEDPLAGFALQRDIETRAYALAGGGFRAPAQTLDTFLADAAPALSGTVRPTYARGVIPAKISHALPPYITNSLREALLSFDVWLPGYALGDALLTAPETRSTSPVRILRNEERTVPGFAGLYPVGEGAGYAGGIISSAVDGLRSAEVLLLHVLQTI